jgi:hypothetical protein
MECWLKVVYVLAAVTFSLFYACYAVTVLGNNGKRLTIFWQQRVSPDEWERLSPQDKKKQGQQAQYHWSWWFHQVWINLLGSAIGWSAGFYLIFCRGRVETLIDCFFLLIALVGVSGFLPWRLFNAPLK